MRHIPTLVLLALGLIGNGHVSAAPVGPSSYLCFDSLAIAGCGTSDSPFKTIDFSNGYFHLENFEDFVNTPGVTTDGSPTIATITPFQRDSVDEDDGVIDGTGGGFGSLINGGVGTSAQSITFEFDETVLGELPTHVGIVWTDGLGLATFAAFDPFDVLLGSIGPLDIAGLELTGQTAEDTFIGWIDTDGISKITISDSVSGIEVDHLQYGNQISSVPIPATAWLIGSALLGLAAVKRRNV